MSRTKLSELRPDIKEASYFAGLLIKVHRELRELHSFLVGDERVIALAPSTYQDQRGLLVATDKRLLFVFKGWLYNSTVSYDYHIIRSQYIRDGAIMSKVKFKLFGDETIIKFTQIWSPAARRIFDYMNIQIERITPMSRILWEESKYPHPVFNRQKRIEHVLTDEMIELDKKYKSGDITEENYVSSKKKLLDAIFEAR